MKKFYYIIFVFSFLDISIHAQFNVCPPGAYTFGVNWGYAVDDQIYWADRRDGTGTIVTTDGGNTWTLNSFSDPTPVYCIHAFNADTAFVISSTIYKTINRGTTWTAASTIFNSPGSFANTIHFFDENNGLAMGDPVDGYFEIYTTTDGGENWVRVPAGSIPAPLSGEYGVINAHAYYNNSYWFPTVNERLFRSTDRGYTWTCSQINGNLGGVPSLAFRDELHGIALNLIESRWVICRTSDGGITWTDYDSLASSIYGAWNIAYIPGTQSIYTINSVSWSGNDLLTMMLFSNDDGMTWHRMDVLRPWVDGDGMGYHVWASPNSGWTSLFHANTGSIYHWAGYSGKHIWRAADHLNFKTRELIASDETFEISVGNYGTEALTINSFNLSSSQYQLVDPPALPLTLQPWDAVDLSIIFNPTDRGFYYDSLTIYSDAANNNAITATLSGKALMFTPPLPGFIYAASDTFYNLTLSNLAAAPIGFFDGQIIEGLTIRPSDSVLIGISENQNNSTLYKIDPVVGACLEMAIIPVGNIRAIAFSPSGTLYAGSKNGTLYTINTSTGEPAPVGSATGKIYSSFAFDPLDSKLYASVFPLVGTTRDAIYIIDTSTGAATLLGQTGDGMGTPSISFNKDGSFYGLKGSGTLVNTLLTIDKTNGQGTVIGSLQQTGIEAIVISSIVTGINDNAVSGDFSYALFQNYPNPWNPATTISYTLKEKSDVRIVIINMLGEEIAVLVNEEQQAGYQEVKFNGSELASGVYFYQLKAGEFIQTKKMILLK